MKPDSPRFRAYANSPHPWEAEAIVFLRDQLADVEPNRIFALFEFVSHEGTISEVDALVVTSRGIFLVEIKSRPGRLTGDASTWTYHTQEGKRLTADSPLFITDKKCKRIKDLLSKQKAIRDAGHQLPFVRPLIFLSAPDLQVELDDTARHHVCTRTGSPKTKSLLQALTQSGDDRADARRVVDAPLARAIEKAMAQAGIRESVRNKRFAGTYELDTLLLEGPGYQDWLASHLTSGKVKRRIRIYPVSATVDVGTRQMFNRAARREFLSLHGIEHQGILRALEFQEGDQGPGLIFDYDPAAVRLDHFLRDEGAKLNLSERLAILRQIAEAVQYAHERRLVHRALSPLSVLIRRDANGFSTWLYNWQTASREATTTSNTGALITQHLDPLVDPSAVVYLAPETQDDPTVRAEHLDVFGLGGIAWLLFTGRPPADDRQGLRERLRRDDGLLLSVATDNVAPCLIKLVQESTRPRVADRFATVGELLRQLDEVENELTRPDDEVHHNPTAAKVGQRFRSGWEIKNRLGQGSTAVVFLVENVIEPGRPQRVLKLALDPDKNATIADERRVLESLHHEAIVQCAGTLECADHLGLLLAKAGDESVAHRLRSKGSLDLEPLQRFGEDLLSALKYLEEQGVFHRDIKPDNLGIAARGRGDHQHLVLFDFSLAKAPLASIGVGTRAYLDPFLGTADRRQYDPAAERYATAVTLFEMATGRLPRWGDGRSAPDLTDDEVDFGDESLFPSAARELLTDFFSKALRRHAKQRFDNAEDMLRQWRGTFEKLANPSPSPTHATEITLGSPVQLLGFSTRAVTVLERLAIDTVQQLLTVPQGRVTKGKGVGAKTREELLSGLARLRAMFPSVVPGSAVARAGVESSPDAPRLDTTSINLRDLAAALVPVPRGRSKASHLHAEILTDLVAPAESRTEPLPWPTQTEVARLNDTTTVAVNQVVAKARVRWQRVGALTQIRDAIVPALNLQGCILSLADVVSLLADRFGEGLADPELSNCARTVLRAAIETESVADARRYELCRRQDHIWVVASQDADGEPLDTQALLRFAQDLGRHARDLANSEPLPPPVRVLETLQQVKVPPRVPSLGPERLVRLAAAAGDVAVSGKLELYPRHMSAERALKLAHGALLGAAELTLRELRDRVHSRYPDAAELPADRAKLQALLQPVLPDLQWDAERQVFRFQSAPRARFTGDRTIGSASTNALPPADAPEVVEAREFDLRLRKALEKYLVLMTGRDDHETVRLRLQARFPELRVISCEHVFLQQLRQLAAKQNIDWPGLLDADAQPPGAPLFQELRQIVEEAAGGLGDLIGADQPKSPILLTRLGVLARYGLLTKVAARLRERVYARAGSAEALAGVWLLVASSETEERPVVDGDPVPVPGGRSDYVTVLKAWTRNETRERAG